MGPVIRNNELYMLTDLDTGAEYFFTAINKAAIYLDTTSASIINMLRGLVPIKVRGKYYACEVIDGSDKKWSEINPEGLMPGMERSNDSGSKNKSGGMKIFC